MDGIRIGTCCIVLLAIEEVDLAGLDRVGVGYLNLGQHRCRRLHREIYPNGTIALATALRQRLCSAHVTRAEDLTSEDIQLIRLDRVVELHRLRRTEGEFQMLRSIVLIGISAGALRRRDGPTAKEVTTAVADGRRVLRVRVGEGSSAQERQQG